MRLAPTQIEALQSNAPLTGRVISQAYLPFGPNLEIQRFELANGLRVLLVPDPSAPVIAYHTWFRVGSRHERVGKTGIAHLFEHLMFNETEHLPKGEFDRRLEEAGAESNASTWLDFTQYSISAPSERLQLVVQLEAERMENLVLRTPQVESEKEVVANERRYRVEDDVEGSMNETLWATAFREHAYRWPTIGWMEDIQGFTTQDCEAFYRTYYAPNNATVVVVGDFNPADALRWVIERYGHLPAAALPLEDVQPEPPQTEERRVELIKPTTTDKLTIGYPAPSLGDYDHNAANLLSEILCGGRASRIYRRLVRELELASEVRMFVGPFLDPGLIELYASARSGHDAQALLQVIDEEIARIQRTGASLEELQRAQARFELGLLHSLETADGKANTIGFYDCLLAQPAAAFERLEALRRVTPSDILRVARRYLRTDSRTLVIARPTNKATPESS